MRTVLAAALAAVIVTPALADPVELKFAFGGPPQAALYSQGIQPWSEQVSKDSDGTIDIKLFPGGTIANLNQAYDRVLNGVADFSYVLTGLYAQQFPRTMVAMLPFETRNPREGGLALWRLYEKGVFDKELSSIKPVAAFVFTNQSLHSLKSITTIADMKGTKVSTQSRILGGVIERLGGAPITMPPTDLYQALQRGTIDAAGIGWPGVIPFKLYEVTSFHIDTPLAAETGLNIMNKDAYARLPAKSKAAIDKLAGLPFTDMMVKAIAQMENQGRKFTKAQPNQTISQIPADEEARWKARAEPVTEEWVKATPDGAQVLAAYRAEIAAIRAGK